MARPKATAAWHDVQADEDLQILALEYGVKDWQAVYDHPKNEELRKKRPNPHVLFEGDRVWIPDFDPKIFEVDTNRTNRFVLHRPQTLLHLRLEDDDHIPHRNLRYEIWVNSERFDPSGSKQETKTGADGVIHHMVPVSREIEVRVWFPLDDDEEPPKSPDEGYTSIMVMPGHMDPVDTNEGVHDRLDALHYDFGDDDPNTIGHATTDAIRRFQLDHGLVPTGQLDDYTRRKLVEVHGS